MSDTTFTKDEFEAEAEISDYIALLKPRVMILVVFTALVGIIAAPVDVHPFTILVSIIFIALGGGASGALNMWYDSDIDRLMRRTRNRPIPAGKIKSGEAKAFGFGLAGMSVLMLGLAANWFAAVFLFFTIFFYIAIYTIWLKRWTPQNIVIGGAAGAFPPMIGWAVATSGISLESILMFSLIFLGPHRTFGLSRFSCGMTMKMRVSRCLRLRMVGVQLEIIFFSIQFYWLYLHYLRHSQH